MPAACNAALITRRANGSSSAMITRSAPSAVIRAVLSRRSWLFYGGSRLAPRVPYTRDIGIRLKRPDDRWTDLVHAPRSPGSGGLQPPVRSQMLRPGGRHGDQRRPARCAAAGDVAAIVCLFPHPQARTRCPPRLQHLGVRPWLGTDPREEIQDQAVDGLGHVVIAAIWMRFPQVSSRTAVVTGPADSGACVNRTPSADSRSYSCSTSSTANEVNGIPSSTRAVLNGLAAGCSSGSSSSSTPSGSSGDTTVSHRCAPSGTSVFFVKPSTSV